MDSGVMDHAQIERDDVVERYVTGRLDPQELTSFEEHFLDCASCCDAVEDAERLQLGLEQVAAEEVNRALRQGFFAALLARARGPLAIAFTLLAAVGSGLAWRDHQRLTSELATLEDTLAEERRPRVNTPVLTFAGRRGDGAVRQISLRDEPEWIVLAIELAEPVAERYRATLSGAAGAELWHSSELEPSFEATLTVSLHSSLLPPGDYELAVGELPSGEVRTFPLRVVRLR